MFRKNCGRVLIYLKMGLYGPKGSNNPHFKNSLVLIDFI